MRQLMTVLLLLSGYLLLADGVQPAGDGSYQEPYEVETLDNLLWVSTNPYSWGAHFIQTANIDASETHDWNGGQGFLPIGTDQYFSGSYDGQGYSIYNLYMNRPDVIRQALFASLSSAIIENVHVLNVRSTGANSTSTLAGYVTYGTIIRNCSSSGKVTGEIEACGGLVGYFRDSPTMENCYSTAEVIGDRWVGGLIGYVRFGAVIEDCYSKGSVQGLEYVGGFVGWLESSHLNNCYSCGEVTCIDHDIGGLVANAISSSTVQNSFWDIETSGVATSDGGTPKSTAQMRDVATFTSFSSGGLGWPWDFVDNPYDDTAYEDIWDIDPLINGGYPHLASSQPQTPPAPVIITCRVVNGVLMIDWDPVSGATSYNVYSTSSLDTPFLLDTSGTFVDTSWFCVSTAERKFYQVTAVFE